MRKNSKQNQKEELIKINNAFYLGNYTLLLQFSNGKQKSLNFLSILKQYAKGEYEKFQKPQHFKKFNCSNGNISWGKNEDIIFPVQFLYHHPKAKIEKEEVLYVV